MTVHLNRPSVAVTEEFEIARMRVIFINRFFYPDHSATSQLLTDLAFYLAESGTSVTVLASRQIYDDPDRVLSSKDTQRAVCIVRPWSTRFGREKMWGRICDYMTFYLSAAWALLVLAKAKDVLIVKTDPPLISVVAAVVAKCRGALVCNWTQDLFPEVAQALEFGGNDWIQTVLRKLRNWSLRTAKCNVAIGEHMAKKLFDEGVPREAITVIHNWADGDSIRPLAREENSLRKAWGLERSFVVGYSGNFGRAHEFETILKVAARLANKQDIVFLFVGGGAQKGLIEDASANATVKNILLKPYQPRDLLATSLTVPDVHLISLRPSLEGLIVPSKFYGIVAAGRPTIFIGDRDGQIPLLLSEGRCGFSFEIGQVEEMRQLISDLADQPEICAKLGLRARALFDARFDRSHAMQAWRKTLGTVGQP